MLENYVRIIQVCVGIENSAQIYYSFPDIRHAFLDRRKAALSKQCKYIDSVLKYSRIVIWTLPKGGWMNEKIWLLGVYYTLLMVMFAILL